MRSATFLAALLSTMMVCGQAKSDTYNFTAAGIFTDSIFRFDQFPLQGNTQFDATNGTILTASFSLVGETWDQITDQGAESPSGPYFLSVETPVPNLGCDCHDSLSLDFPSLSTLIANNGGPILNGSAGLADAGFAIYLQSGTLTEKAIDIKNTSATPDPNAAVLFAAGLALIGALARRRKRSRRARSTDMPRPPTEAACRPTNLGGQRENYFGASALLRDRGFNGRRGIKPEGNGC